MVGWARAELLVLPALSIRDAERLTSDLLRDPLCNQENRAVVLAAFAERLDADANTAIKPNQPWGGISEHLLPGQRRKAVSIPIKSRRSVDPAARGQFALKYLPTICAGF